MARYTGPRARVCRRLEFPVFESPKFSNPRKNYPCLVTMKYEESIDAFIEKISPYPSWTLNSSTGKYEAPAVKVEKADDGVDATCPIPQYWDEASGSWKLDDYTV